MAYFTVTYRTASGTKQKNVWAYSPGSACELIRRIEPKSKIIGVRKTGAAA